MTPEERAVIEAAKRASDEIAPVLWATESKRDTVGRLVDAIHALRESRKPKPLWRLHGENEIRLQNDLIRIVFQIDANAGSKLLPPAWMPCWTHRDRVLDALNRAEPV